MLRASDLHGFQTSREDERLITSLFADDTTVYLSANDSLETLQQILERWCRCSGAKFNTNKTIYLPVGNPEYRAQVAQTRLFGPHHIPEGVQIAADGTPVRMLGAYIGNGITNPEVWTPTLDKLKSRLAQWDKSRPTQDGKRLIIGMEVGGLTQYLTRVQGMSTNIEDNIQNLINSFMWNGNKSAVSQDWLQQVWLPYNAKLVNAIVEVLQPQNYWQTDMIHVMKLQYHQALALGLQNLAYCMQ